MSSVIWQERLLASKFWSLFGPQILTLKIAQQFSNGPLLVGVKSYNWPTLFFFFSRSFCVKQADVSTAKSGGPISMRTTPTPSTSPFPSPATMIVTTWAFAFQSSSAISRVFVKFKIVSLSPNRTAKSQLTNKRKIDHWNNILNSWKDLSLHNYSKL